MLFLGARVGLEVGITELLERGVGIDLCGGETAVSEQRLDGVDVGAVIEHLGGKSVSENVWRVLLERRYLAHARTNNLVYLIHGDTDPFVAEEERLSGRIGESELLVAQGLIGLHPLRQLVSKGNDTLFAALAEDADLTELEVDVAVTQSRQFGFAHACLVQYIDDKTVAHREEIVRIIHSFLRQLHLGLLEEDGERFVHLGGDDCPRDVLVHITNAQHEAPERAEGRQFTPNGTGFFAGIQQTDHPVLDISIGDQAGVEERGGYMEIQAELLQILLVRLHRQFGVVALDGDIVDELADHTSLPMPSCFSKGNRPNNSASIASVIFWKSAGLP